MQYKEMFRFDQFTAARLMSTHDREPLAGAGLNTPGPRSSPSTAGARRSPCTWPAAGPRRTCPPGWAARGPAGRRAWSAEGSRTGRGRAPSWPGPRPDTPGPRRRTAGSWTTGWSDPCRRCSGTDLRKKPTGVIEAKQQRCWCLSYLGYVLRNRSIWLLYGLYSIV